MSALFTKHTNHGPNDAPAVPACTPGAGAAPEWGRDFGCVRVSGLPAGDARGAHAKCASVSDHERLRAFASSYERLRANLGAPSRVWSRLVAFSRALFFFVSGHVWACSIISCRILSSFFVIFRHFSSFLVPIFFSGYGGQRAVAAPLGREGSRLLRVAPAAGAGCASCHDIRFKLVCNCGRAAAAFVYVQHNCTTRLKSLQLLGIPGRISVWGWVAELL